VSVELATIGRFLDCLSTATAEN